MNKTLRHEEADRVPVSDLFWGSFIERWRRDLGLPEDTDPYLYYDLDWQVTVPNMDPHIMPFEIIEETDTKVTVKTGFEAVITKHFADPMPRFDRFLTNEISLLESFEFDDPWDQRRYLESGDNQLAGMGDGFSRNTPAWIETVQKLWRDFPVYGSVCEGHETLWRIIGQENTLTWSLMYPDELGRFIQRINHFMLEIAKAQIHHANGLLDGMVIWGDVAYKEDLLFSPEFWRKYFKPGIQAITEYCHQQGLPVIYHGCGNVNRIFEDFIEIGIDAYNPLEAKAGMDVIDLRKRFGHQIAFCGNMDVMEWANCTKEELKAILLRKLNAAKGGGFIFQSDHSVPDNVSGQNYDYVIKLVRKHGTYPLNLEAFDLHLSD